MITMRQRLVESLIPQEIPKNQHSSVDSHFISENSRSDALFLPLLILFVTSARSSLLSANPRIEDVSAGPEP
ncbi:hypothetical protein L1987_47073 [Smallanthus sonchifolius]|uniref:Uncharacterized protein n=1 Tax=Smallanthus sonchifolius TaxID=185202 RepID=A0ACB9G1J7_9ASTR|nr:hypothetical protein L1987_47073 [Smallanthus sonchifolius]